MGAGNVDIFKHIVFSLSPLPVQIAAMVLLSPVYASLTYLAFNAFTLVELFPGIIPAGAMMIFFIPSFVAAELFYRVLPEYPRNWSYFPCADELAVRFHLRANPFRSGYGCERVADHVAGADTVGLSNVLVLTVSVAHERLKRIIPISIVQPLLTGVFQLFIGQRIGIPESVIVVHFGVF